MPQNNLINVMLSPFKTKVLIPGKWKDHNDLMVSLNHRKNYLFAGLILNNLKTNTSFTAYLNENWSHKDYLAEFSNMSADKASSIHSALVIEADNGSFDSLMKLCEAISEILKIGGYGVKITNSAKFISQEQWSKLEFSPQTLFELFVSFYPNEKGIITCGMSNFGKRDVLVPLTPDEESINFILSYAWYIINEQHQIKAGETFSLSKDAPIFKIFEEADNIREPEHPLYNPYGLWKLWPEEWLKD